MSKQSIKEHKLVQLSFLDYTLHILSQRKIQVINLDKIKQDTHDYDMRNLQYERVINLKYNPKKKDTTKKQNKTT